MFSFVIGDFLSSLPSTSPSKFSIINMVDNRCWPWSSCSKSALGWEWNVHIKLLKITYFPSVWILRVAWDRESVKDHANLKKGRSSRLVYSRFHPRKLFTDTSLVRHTSARFHAARVALSRILEERIEPPKGNVYGEIQMAKLSNTVYTYLAGCDVLTAHKV